MWKWLWNQAVSRGCKKLEEHNRKSLNSFEQAGSRNLDFKNTASEDSQTC